MEFECIPAGDRAVLIRFRQEISEEINQQVLSLARALEEHPVKGVEEWVPAYASLMIYYNPFIIEFYELIHEIRKLDWNGADRQKTAYRIHHIPVLYGGEYGPDLEDVAKYHGFTPEEVIQLHSAPLYHVYMLGFSPVFPTWEGWIRSFIRPDWRIQGFGSKQVPSGLRGGKPGFIPFPRLEAGGSSAIRLFPFFIRKIRNILPFFPRGVKFIPVTREEYLSIQHQHKHGRRGGAGKSGKS